MKKGDIVKFTVISKEILVQLTSKPSSARSINGVSDKDELFFNGRVLNRTRNKFCLDARYKSDKPFIVKANEITLVQEYTKLRLFFDNNIREHSEYDTLEQAEEFINKVKFQWVKAYLVDAVGNIVYEKLKEG